MKILLSFAIFYGIFSCQQPSVQLTDTERAAIIDSVKAQNAGLMKAAENVDADRFMTYFSRSPNFRFINQEGPAFTQIDSFHNFCRRVYTGFKGQVVKVRDPFINILSPEYALSSQSGDVVATLKDGSTISGPFSWTILWINEAGRWKAIHCHQSFKTKEGGS